MDNHFSGDVVSKYLGEGGFKHVCTCRQDRLPGECKKWSFHHVKAVEVNARSGVAIFDEPFVAVKYVNPTEEGKESYCVTHVSFQSTGSTNIQSVNALPGVGLYVRERAKGSGSTKRTWGIEMNEGRELYLKLYGAVDKLDQQLKLWRLYYVTWRWWHAPKRHGKAIAFSMAQ